MFECEFLLSSKGFSIQKEEIGFYNIQLKTSYCDDSELLFILHTSFSVLIF